ncbi:MAG: J domain-containing protein [Chloroflexaceae bacterium]|nr:J domain-containing protein [Chloroflexaceae bacterium]
MGPEFQDYYAVLGIEPDASDQTIKQTYRKLARQYHPDVNPGDKQAEEQFKAINEAYQALGDPEKRRKYDQLRQQYQQWQQRGKADQFNWDQWQAAPGERVYTRTVSPEDLEDLFGDASPFSDFFSSVFGGAAAASAASESRSRRGRDIDAAVAITLEEAFHGTARTLQVGERRIEARIPRGVTTGSRIRLSGQGQPGMGQSSAGDLYLVIEVEEHAQFERQGDDLHGELAIDIYTAATGGETRVQTIDGPVMLKIPPRTQAGRLFRLRNKGMPRLEQTDQRGDFYARAQIVLPEAMSDDEIAALQALAQTYHAR